MTRHRHRHHLSKWIWRAHAMFSVLWLAMIPVTLVTSLRTSVPFLVAISLWALFAAHAAALAAESAEIRVEAAADAAQQAAELLNTARGQDA